MSYYDLDIEKLTELEIMDVNYLREVLDAEPLDPGRRQCLKCDKMFNSWGKANRICEPCSSLNASMGYVELAEGGMTIREFCEHLMDDDSSELPWGYTLL